MSSNEKSSPSGVALLMNDLQKLPLTALVERSVQSGLRLRPDLTRRHLVVDQVRHSLQKGLSVTATGLLERESSCSPSLDQKILSSVRAHA